MDVSWLAAVIIGVLQPFAQEAITRGRYVGRAATIVTVAASFVGGALAVYLTGGFASVHVPSFSLLDPSPLVLFIADQSAKIMLIARITYAIPGVGATPATSSSAATSAPGSPGLVQKIAGTTSAPVATVPPTP